MNRLSFFKTLALGLTGAAFAPNLLLPKSPDAYRWKRGTWIYTTEDFTFNERDYMGSWKFITFDVPNIVKRGDPYLEISGRIATLESILT